MTKPPPADWVVTHMWPRGTELTFTDHCGINRRASYRRTVTTGTGQTWHDVVELSKGEYRVTRSIRGDMIRRVWKKKRKQATRKTRLKERNK